MRTLACPALAAALSAASVLGVSAQPSVQLVEGSSNENYWAEGYTRRSQNILNAQSTIAATVAAAVEEVVTTHRPRRQRPPCRKAVSCQSRTEMLNARAVAAAS